METDTSIRRAGGFIIQLLPDATDEMIEKLEKKLATLPSVSDLLDMGKTPEDILQMILEIWELKRIMDTVPTEFGCNCTRERVEKALISIGRGTGKRGKSSERKGGVNSEAGFMRQGRSIYIARKPGILEDAK